MKSKARRTCRVPRAFPSRQLLQATRSIRTGTMVGAIGADNVELGAERLPAGLALWAAGVRASPLGVVSGLGTGDGGRIPVHDDLSVPGHPWIFALGDLALLAGTDGRPLPGLAQVARQQGIHLGRELVRQIRSGKAIRPFRYASRGDTAIIGRHAAIYQLGGLRLRGWIAWALWAIVHVYLLVGFQHRLTVSVQWLWRYLTYERGARLISAQHEPGGGRGGQVRKARTMEH